MRAFMMRGRVLHESTSIRDPVPGYSMIKLGGENEANCAADSSLGAMRRASLHRRTQSTTATASSLAEGIPAARAQIFD